jgi:hypothetical protein
MRYALVDESLLDVVLRWVIGWDLAEGFGFFQNPLGGVGGDVVEKSR